MKVFVFTAAVLAFCVSSHAAIVQPSSASASSDAGASYVPTNTINGSGLLGAVSTLPAHGPYDNSPANHWTSNGSTPLDEWIQWGFAAPQNLDTIYLWNHQSTTPLAANASYDVTAFALTFFNAGNTIIGTYSGTLAVDSSAAQAFNFGFLSGVSAVRFDVNGTQGSTSYTGLAEVAFNTATAPAGVPDASTTASLLAVSLMGLVAFSRNRLAA